MVDGTPPAGTTGTTVNVSPNPQAAGEWWEVSESAAAANKAMEDAGQTANTVKGFFERLNDQLGSVGDGFKSLEGMTDEQATTFGLITTATLGATEAFKNLANVDTSRLTTFEGQLRGLFDIIKAGPGTAVAGRAMELITNQMLKMGASSSKVGEVIKDLSKGIVGTAMQFFRGADNVLKMQNAMMQLTISGGGAKSLFDEISPTLQGVGKDFYNLNDVTTKYRDVLSAATVALGGNQEKAMEYMAEINKMPGGLRALTEPMQLAGNQTNMLVATIDYLVGSGRDQTAVFKDINQAMTEYAATGDQALRFTARMSEVADALSDPVHNVFVQIKDVQTALSESAEAFKMFVSHGADAGKMTQGMADAMKSYVSELTSVGVPAQNAISMFQQYTRTMSQMNLGQQAFISSMAGGPGGLRGAFAMDAMMRRGDFEGIRRQVEQTIRRMTGPIVSLDEAQRSESAAAQYTRQIQLLQQGPLGALARTRPEAESLLQAMKEGRRIPTTGKDVQQSMVDIMTRGQEWQKGTYTEAARMATGIKNIELMFAQSNLRVARGLTGATGMMGGGGGGTGAGISPETQARLGGWQRTARVGMTEADILRDAGDAIADFPVAIREAGSSIKESATGNVPAAFRPTTEYVPAGRQVGHSVATAGTAHPGGLGAGGGRMTATGGIVTGGTAAHPVPVTLSPGSALTVNFTGVCPHCGTDIRTTSVARVISPQASVRH